MGAAILNEHGQVTIEFLLVLVIMLLYVQVLVIPISDSAVQAIEDVSRVANATLSTSKIVDNISFVSSLPGNSRQVVYIYVPKDSEITCNQLNNSVDFKVNLHKTAVACTANLNLFYCIKQKKLSDDIFLQCGFQKFVAGSQGFTQGITIKKNGSLVTLGILTG